MPLNNQTELQRFTEKYGYNKVWAELENQIGSYANDFDLISGFSLFDIELMFARNLFINGCCFQFDAVYAVTVSYTDAYRDEQTKTQWFTINCVAEVDDEFKSFDVISLNLYTKLPNKNNATESFVPVMYKKQMDAHATAFLREYYPKALLEPTAVPIREIADDMGLELQFGYMLSEDFSFFGQISFSDIKTRVFNLETGKSQDIDVTRGTILIDPEVFWERSLGCENFTIAHEVVHWEKHKLFADIKRLLDRNYYKPYRCPKPMSILWDSNDKWSDNEWLEWQANGIAARILMPAETVPRKVKEISAKFSPDIMANQTEYYIALIDELAKFYGTSRQTTKYRLKELGHKALEVIQIHDYDYQAYTHKIDEYKAYYELFENAELRLMVSAGVLVYADNHFVLNHEKCVTFDKDGVPHLTNFAWANLSKCAVKFKNVRINIKESDSKFSDILYRNSTFETFQKYSGKDNANMFEFAREFAAEFKAKAPEREKLRVSLSDRVQQIFDAKGIDAPIFQELTLLSRDTYYKLKKQDYKPTFETVIAICAGLDLDIGITDELLKKASYSFDGSEKHTAYMVAITNFSGQSILVRNEFLRSLDIKGVKPLGEKDSE